MSFIPDLSITDEATIIFDELIERVPELLNIKSTAEEVRFRQAVLVGLRKSSLLECCYLEKGGDY